MSQQQVPQENPDAAELLRAMYDEVTARRRLERDASRPMSGPAYDPHAGFGRRRIQAVRPLPPRKAIALYLYELLVMIVVVGSFLAVIHQ